MAFFLIVSRIAVSDGYKVPQYAYGLTACDIDNDGDIDIVVGSDNQGFDTLSILLNDGFGHFTISHIARSNHSKVFCSCVNSDELPDIITRNSNDSAWVYYPGLEDGNFDESQIIYKVMGETIYMCNLEEDNSPDFISHDWGVTGAFGVLYNNGSGIFTHYDIYSSDSPVVEPDVGDLNGDGLIDILTSDYGEGVLIFYNLGYDNFEQQLFDATPVSNTYILDFDGDETNDLGLFQHRYFLGEVCTLKIFMNQSNNFILTDSVLFPTGTMIREFADFNNDNYLDIAYIRGVWGMVPIDSLYIALNNQDMTFSPPDLYSVNVQGLLQVISKDFDGNGYLDFAYTYFGAEDSVVVLFNDGTGKFQNNPLTSIKSHDEEQINISVYPNPFNSVTRISFEAKTGVTSGIKINISDLNGRAVKDFSEADLGKSEYQYHIIWDGKDNSGTPCSPGIYLFKYQDGNALASGRIILMK